MADDKERAVQKSGVHHQERRSNCAIACTLDILGDRWTMLIIRDLFRGCSRYGEFLKSGEGITTSLLADRLKRLQHAGLVERKPYSEHPPRFEYFLTAKGRSLSPVLGAVVNWGKANIANTRAYFD